MVMKIPNFGRSRMHKVTRLENLFIVVLKLNVVITIDFAFHVIIFYELFQLCCLLSFME